ncbi:MAG: hypothetical protein H6610_11835 [Ignavibacteriales bacterium]|nr:hypothetical protein [Ignavibacteriales bacterium]
MTNLKKITTIILVTLFSSAFLFAAVEKLETKTFKAKLGGLLNVETDKGSITVKTHTQESIDVEILFKVKTEDEELADDLIKAFVIDYDDNGSDLTIKAKYKGDKSWLSNLFGGSKWNKLNVKFTITVPERFNVDLNTSGGGINVGDLEGFVNAETSGGGLTFGNIKGDIDGETSGGGITVGECSGNIKIGTSGGGIKIEKCEGKVDAHTSGGGITVHEVYGPIKASTSGGSVFASILEQPNEDCSLETSGGGITVKLAGNINLYLDAKTSGGSVQTDFPVSVKGKIKSSQLQGAINAGGPKLYLRSSGGSIHVEEN